MKVTATEGGSTGSGMILSVKVITGGALTQNGAVAVTSGAALSPPELAITPNATGSIVFGAMLTAGEGSGSSYTPTGATTYYTNTVQSDIQYGTLRSTSATTTSTPVTLGGTAPTGNTTGGIALAEVLVASGATLAVDASTPADTAYAAVTTLTCAAFTPPLGALLVVMAVGLSGSGQATMTITDTAGLGLSWTALEQANAADNGYAGVWIAQIPSLGLVTRPVMAARPAVAASFSGHAAAQHSR